MIDLNVIYNEDCLETMSKMPRGGVDIIVTSPPFNAGKDYGPDYDDKREDYDEWITLICQEMERVASVAVYVFISQKKMFVIKQALGGFAQWLFWHRPNIVGTSPRFPWILTVTPIAMSWTNGRKPMRSDCSGVRTFDLIVATGPQSNFKGEKKRVHVTQDPIEAYIPIIGRTPGDIVYDPFIGSGSVALAAIKLGRQFIGSEISLEYCAIANQRIERTLAQGEIF